MILFKNSSLRHLQSQGAQNMLPSARRTTMRMSRPEFRKSNGRLVFPRSTLAKWQSLTKSDKVNTLNTSLLQRFSFQQLKKLAETILNLSFSQVLLVHSSWEKTGAEAFWNNFESPADQSINREDINFCLKGSKLLWLEQGDRAMLS